MEPNTHFNESFSKYSTVKDKFDSLYIFVIYKLNLEDSYEKISKIINIIDSMSDTKKKNYLKCKLHNFREYLNTNYKPEEIINGIFMVNHDVKFESLIPYYSQTLNMFSHNKISYEYDCIYPIEWLKNLLLDREYINVIKVKNNDISHTKMNSTKKIIVYSSTIKSMELDKIVEERIPKGESYLIHGSSSVLKNYIDKNAVSVHGSELNDEAILKIASNIKNLQFQTELEDILSKLLDPKIGSKIVFGKDIKLCIKNSLLKTIYCTELIKKQLLNIPQHLINFEIKVIKQIEKGDIYSQLEKDFSGAVGIKYY
jgi:hypothetical protein